MRMLLHLCQGTLVFSGSTKSDGNVVMACAALNGYHSVVKYQWLQDGQTLDENTPLLYTGNEGVYKCQVTGDAIDSFKSFKVTSKIQVP